MSTHREPQSATSESDENMAAWEAGLARIDADLRARFPELFDESGALVMERAMSLIRQRTGGKTEFTGSEFLELMGQRSKREANAP